MKNYLFTVVCLLCFAMPVIAQSGMTDDQVLEFVMKQRDAGASQQQIITQLMKNGVDINQIRRIRKKYERQLKNGGLGIVADEAVAKADETMRKNNGEPKKTQKKGSTANADVNSQRIGTSSTGLKSKTNVQEDDADFVSMSNEVGEMFQEDVVADNADDKSLFRGNKVFGRDIFNKDNLTFEPAMNIATPQNYVVGPGDVVKLDIYGASQKSETYTISPDGEITVENFGPINLSGLTVAQANARLRSRLGSRYGSSSIKMTLGQTRTISVNVMGEVNTPGTFTLSAFATVFHALYMAGGISEIGTLRNIKVYRAGKLISQVDVYDYILNGNLKGNVRLADNDVIVVGPYDCLVNLTGKVKRPMYYEMKKTESMQSLLKYAGGFANDAYTKTIRVNRKTGRQYAVYNVTEFDMSSFRVCDGDSVSVDSIIPRYENMVEIKGAVFRPGMYQLGGEVTSVRSLLQMCEGVTEDAFTNRAVMHRMKEDRTLEVLAVDVKGILDGTVADIPLRNEDVLFVPTKQTSLEDQTITIHGEVQYPGIYRYADNETLEDFILQAGGLTEAASVMKVDVARRDFSVKSVVADSIIARTFSFELKDGFVIDGELGFKLEPFDEVYVRKNPNYSKQQNITIEGEVNFAGTYTLPKRDTRLSDIIKSAGGFTLAAYPSGARLERRMTKDERLRMESVLKAAKANSGDKDSVDVTKLDLGTTFYVGIELEKAVNNPRSSYDVVLREGDRIIVPEYNSTVKINGAVMMPNTIAYREGRSAKWYIQRAGGYGNTAKKSRTYIIRQNGMVEKVTSRTKVTPGSEIVVPEKVKKINSLQQTSIFVSMASAIGTLGAVLVSALK